MCRSLFLPLALARATLFATVWTFHHLIHISRAHPHFSVFRVQSSNLPIFPGAVTQEHLIYGDYPRTLAQAKARALELPGCAGFTFKSTNLTPALPSGSADIDTASYTPDRYRVYFKSRRNGNTDGLWQTYLLADWTGADPAQTPWP